jgi:hypothetical protein
MATITFTYAPDYDENDTIDDASSLTASVEYRLEVPKKVDLTIDDMYAHFNQWLRGLGYHPK